VIDSPALLAILKNILLFSKKNPIRKNIATSLHKLLNNSIRSNRFYFKCVNLLEILSPKIKQYKLRNLVPLAIYYYTRFTENKITAEELINKTKLTSKIFFNFTEIIDSLSNFLYQKNVKFQILGNDSRAFMILVSRFSNCPICHSKHRISYLEKLFMAIFSKDYQFKKQLQKNLGNLNKIKSLKASIFKEIPCFRCFSNIFEIEPVYHN
jgi:hypothetical protein